jgi:uncharacterized protein
MALFDKINEDLKAAMLARDQGALRAVRAIKAALLLAKTETGKDITPDEEIRILQRLVKQRKDSIEIFSSKNREDLALGEKEELVVIEKYLPQQISQEELKKELLQIISESGAKSTADLGKMMGLATKKLAGKSDGKSISEMAKQLLSAL